MCTLKRASVYSRVTPKEKEPARLGGKRAVWGEGRLKWLQRGKIHTFVVHSPLHEFQGPFSTTQVNISIISEQSFRDNKSIKGQISCSCSFAISNGRPHLVNHTTRCGHVREMQKWCRNGAEMGWNGMKWAQLSHHSLKTWHQARPPSFQDQPLWPETCWSSEASSLLLSSSH